MSELHREKTYKIYEYCYVMFIHRNSCPICNSSNNKNICSITLDDPIIVKYLQKVYPLLPSLEGSFKLDRCVECTFIWQTDIFNEEYMHKFYDQWIPIENSITKKNSSLVLDKYCREIRYIRNKVSSEGVVLDYGMGAGTWCLMAKAYGLSITGLELSKSRNAYAKKNGVKVISDLQELNDNSISFINMEQVLEHLSDPLETLNQLKNKLTDGGLIRVAIPSGEGILTRIMKEKLYAKKVLCKCLSTLIVLTKNQLKN